MQGAACDTERGPPDTAAGEASGGRSDWEWGAPTLAGPLRGKGEGARACAPVEGGFSMLGIDEYCLKYKQI